MTVQSQFRVCVRISTLYTNIIPIAVCLCNAQSVLCFCGSNVGKPFCVTPELVRAGMHSLNAKLGALLSHGSDSSSSPFLPLEVKMITLWSFFLVCLFYPHSNSLTSSFLPITFLFLLAINSKLKLCIIFILTKISSLKLCVPLLAWT